MSATLRVLMIAYYFPPCGGPSALRAVRWVRHLPDFGVQLTVIAPEAGVFPMVDESLAGLVPDSVEVRRVRAFLPSAHPALRSVRGGSYSSSPGVSHSSPLRRGLRWLRDTLFVPDEYVGFSRAAAAEGLRLHRARAFDGLFTLSQPHSVHLAGRRLRRSTGLPWAAQFGDPWMDNWFPPPSAFTRRLLEPRMERSVLRECDLVLGTTDRLRDRWRERFPELPAERFRSLPAGYDELDFAGLGPEVFDRWTLVHIGNLYRDRSAGPFLDGLGAYLESNPGQREGMRVVFAGAKDEENREQFDAAVRRHGLEGIVVDRGFTPHREALRMMLGADALLYLGGEPPEGDINVACKVFEYLRAARPVLAVAREVEATRILGRAPFFVRADRGDVAGVCRALERLRALPAALPAPEAPRDCEASVLARTLADWFHEAVAARAAGRGQGGA
ncbi:MAG: hypothetical protein HZB25_11965 [Candidatus Eisenbacteria bacterium]|nr:hypothetical protein [Candidatus Eisenbacteria bacterium]